MKTFETLEYKEMRQYFESRGMYKELNLILNAIVAELGNLIDEVKL